MTHSVPPEQSVAVAFGRGHLNLSLPAEAAVTTIRKRALPKLANPADAIHRALEAEPIDAPPLSRLAAGKRSACILICDITRPVPNRLFLRPMIETMVAAGIPLDRITVLVATGLHRPNLGEELAELVGDPWCWRRSGSRTTMPATTRITSTSAAPRPAARPSASIAASPRRSSGSPRDWSSPISWPAGRAAAR